MTDQRDRRRPVSWGHHMEFLLSCIGYCVGMGNLWRFPYLCMRNGGGAFLIPYVCFMVLLVIPLNFLEMSLGQFSRLGPAKVWKFCPLFKGAGISSATLCFVCMLYYNMVTAWTLYYIGHSFTWNLPWTSCGHPWNTPACEERSIPRLSEANLSLATKNVTGVPQKFGLSYFEVNMSDLGKNNALLIKRQKSKTPSEEFWHFNVLEMTPSIEEWGGLRWQVVLCLLAAWILVFICIFNGIKTSGKVVYVTATLPYLLLTVLLVRAAMLDGAIDGIKVYVIPDFEKLTHISVWFDAAVQILFSAASGWGVVLSMTSYNKFNNNHLRDSLFIVLINSATSVFAGFVIFTVLGVMAKQAGVSVAKVVTSGPGLAFIVYPEALAKLPGAPVWAVLFFLMVISLVLDSQFGMVEMFTGVVMDAFPALLKRRPLVTAVVCVCCFLLGLPFTMRAGIYFFQIVDWYCSLLIIPVIGMIETLAVSYIYGGERIYYDISLMLGTKPNIWWRICWGFITPFILLGILVISLEGMTPPHYGDYYYPTWALAIGWITAVIAVVPIPICMVTGIAIAKGSIKQRLISLLRPAKGWGPASEEHWIQYKYGNQDLKVDTEQTDKMISEDKM